MLERFCDQCGAAVRESARFCHFCSQKLDQLHFPFLLHHRWNVLKQIDKGGMGVIYCAQDMHLNNRIVAVKEIAYSSTDEYVQCKKEANILAQLDHQAIPTIYDAFEQSGRFYLILQYIPGKNLEQFVGKRKMRPELVFEIADQLCMILQYLHNQQPPIVFRDLKPSNIMLQADKSIYLIDFGIARVFTQKTKDTTAIGSPGYTAPEQHGKLTTTKSDVYALATLMHRLLTAELPEDQPFVFSNISSMHTPASNALQALFEAMHSFKPEYRPDIETVQAVLKTIAYGWDTVKLSALIQPQITLPKKNKKDGYTLITPIDAFETKRLPKI